jgi:hypothetical protein
MEKIIRTPLTVLAFLITFGVHSLVQKEQNMCHLMENVQETISVNEDTGIDEKAFNEVLDNFEKVYGPIVKETGNKLVIKRKWSDSTINASTTRQGNMWIVNAYGGLARHKLMDRDGYLMVMCHEIGHQLGGYPARGWASNEGQSDYYATMKCFRRMMLAGFVNMKADVPPSVKSACSVQHKTYADIKMCEKGASAGFTVANVLNSLSKSSTAISFDTPDKTEVVKTNNNHPKAQCRLDTYYAGAVCGVHYSEEFSPESPINGACAEEKKDIFGVRPRCWYKPQ